MAKIFRDDAVEIWKPLFSNTFHVKELATGRIAKATAEMAEKCAEKLRHAAAVPMTEAERLWVNTYIFDRFAATALHPGSFPAEMFLSGSPDIEVSGALAAFRQEVAPRGAAETAPEPPAQPWSYAREVDVDHAGGRLWLHGNAQQAWASYDPQTAPTEALRDDAERYFDLETMIWGDSRFTPHAQAMTRELQRLLHRTVFEHRRESEFFRESGTDFLLWRLHDYCANRKAPGS